MQYYRTCAGPAVSAFQKKIRGGNTVLRDHICKQMNELNLERCRCIPKEVPGADWRCLEQLVAQDPARELYKVHCNLYCIAGVSNNAIARQKKKNVTSFPPWCRRMFTFRKQELPSLFF